MRKIFYINRIVTSVLIILLLLLGDGQTLLSQTPQKPSTCINLDFKNRDFTNWVGRTSVYAPNHPDANNCNQSARVIVNCASASGLSCNGCFSGCRTPGPCTAPGVPVPASVPACMNPPLTVSGQFYDNIGPIVPGRHTLITTSVPDPYACNNIMTLPAGDPVCARLGSGGRNQFGTPPGNTGVGWEIDYLSYTFKVDASNSLLTYKYAVVLQDPLKDPTQPEHSKDIRPRFNVFVRDSTLHELIDPICGKFEVTYDTAITGFRACSLPDIQGFGGNPFSPVGTVYRAWTTVSVDLRKQINNLVTITFNTWDCGWGGHFGYAYITARCDSFAIQQKGCNPDGSITLIAPPGFSYSWPASGQTTQSINVKGSNPGDTVKVLLTTANGCTTDIYTVIYPTTLTAKMKPAPLVDCIQGNNFSFVDSSYSIYSGNGANVPIVKWDWKFGDGNTFSTVDPAAKNPSHSYMAEGTYSVTLVVTNFQGCLDSIEQVVVVLPPPVASFSPSNVCEGESVTFQDLSTVPIGAGVINSWSWTFLDNNTTSLDTNPQHLYSKAGTYSVNLRVTTTIGCWDDTTITVNIFPKPLANFSNNVVCSGDSTTFTDLSIPGDPLDPIVKWIWIFGDGSPLTGVRNPTHIFPKANTYSTQLIVTTVKGCVHNTTLNVIVLPPPKADFDASPLCFGAPVIFQDLSTATPPDVINSWSWSFGDGTPIGTEQNPSHPYLSDSLYHVHLDVTTLAGCKNTISKPVLIPPVPEADFDSDKYKGCVPLCINFYDLSHSPDDPVAKWDWDFGDGGTGNIEKPYHCYNDTGVFTVSLSITTVNGCKQSFTWFSMIYVYPFPIADFDFNPKNASTKDPTINFIYQAKGAKTWQWDLGDGNTSTDLNPIHTYPEAGQYTIWQYVQNQWGCRDSIAKVVVITPEWAFYIPDAFSPNGDGKNEGFIGKGYNVIEHQMWIYDRWGNQIYTTGQTPTLNDAIPWNGKANGGSKMAQEDVYVWVVQFRDIFNKRHKLIGHVTLVR